MRRTVRVKILINNELTEVGGGLEQGARIWDIPSPLGVMLTFIATHPLRMVLTETRRGSGWRAILIFKPQLLPLGSVVLSKV